MIKIEVLSHYLFDEKMKQMGLNDDNVENTDMAFISVIGTEECLKYYLEEETTKHYFKDHPNVLNLEFDDIEENVKYNGHLFKTMTIEQAENTVDFIEKMIQSQPSIIYVHCRAGMSRSRAIGEAIYRYCMDNNIEVEYNDRNDYITMLNYGVFNKIQHAYWKKNHLMMYEDKNRDYPNELINVPLKIINRNDK